MSRPPSNDALADQLADDRRAALRLVPVSRETEERLATFVELLDRWRHKINLISNPTFASVWTRHIADSAQLIALAPDAKRWVDLGSGAGFPGLVIAIQLADVPGAVVHCIESDGRKCAFLREATRATGAAAADSPRACRDNRVRKPRSCGRRHRAGLCPLVVDPRIGETVDGARRHCRVSARRIS